MLEVLGFTINDFLVSIYDLFKVLVMSLMQLDKEMTNVGGRVVKVNKWVNTIVTHLRGRDNATKILVLIPVRWYLI